jgi:DNA polymerase III delta prime subunit
MEMRIIKENARDILHELEWLKQILRTRSDMNAGLSKDKSKLLSISPPQMNGSTSGYAMLLKEYQFSTIERFLLILAAAPHIKPEILDVFLQKNKATNQLYTEFGGRIGERSNGFLPTGETAMFVLAGNDLSQRFELLRPFEADHVFARKGILTLEAVPSGEPMLTGLLTISQEVLDQITSGKVRKPTFSSEFPARLLDTSMKWKDLVLNPNTLEQIDEILTWLEYKEVLMNHWGMSRVLNPGFKTLFYGPPGTGKTLTATLLGKKTGMDVYRVDLSQMVSKYIGETEKNLAKVFAKAEFKQWILFFDECDAIFGKRVQTKDSNDRHANQQVSYLLQRIEDYDGLVILATNLKSNIDDAFLRRFQSIIHFPMPSSIERQYLWKNGFSAKCTLEKSLSLPSLAQKYELSGGSIINVIQYSSLKSLKRADDTIYLRDVLNGIKQELLKIGRTI